MEIDNLMLFASSHLATLMSFDVQFSIPFKRIGIPKVMMILLILIVKFH